MATDSDRELVAAARAGSREAAATLFERHWPRAWRIAYTLVGNSGRAEDVAQEAFVRAFASLATFDGRSAFSTWLHRIAVNVALSTLRSERRLDDREPPAAAGDDVLSDRAVRDAVAALPLERRAAVVLRYWLDYPPAEIAELLGVPVGTVHSRLARGLAELRAQLEVPDADRA